MYIKLVSFISALVLGSAAFLGLSATPALADTTAQPTPVVSTTPQSGTPEAQSPKGKLDVFFHKVRRGLIQAAADVTGKTPKDIIQSLRDGQSLSTIVTSAGKTTQDLLTKFDELLKSLFARIEGKTNLPADKLQQAQTQIEDAVSKRVDQKGFPLNTGFPEPMLIRRALVRSAVEVGGLEPSAVKDGLKACQSLNDLLVANGHTGQEAVDAALKTLEPQLDNLVNQGKLTQEQRDKLDANLSAMLTKLVNAPGLHPNQQCTPSSGNG